MVVHKAFSTISKMEGLMSWSGMKLSTLEWQNIAVFCQQTFHFQYNKILIQSKTQLFFSSPRPSWMSAKVQISLHFRISTMIPKLFINISLRSSNNQFSEFRIFCLFIDFFCEACLERVYRWICWLFDQAINKINKISL